ncbi:hypothetical protein V8B55DRAFT_1438819 [Mucor lusitanicus]
MTTIALTLYVVLLLLQISTSKFAHPWYQLSTEGNWLRITQIEVYTDKDKSVDNAAIATKYDESHPNLTIKFDKVTEGKGTMVALDHYQAFKGKVLAD